MHNPRCEQLLPKHTNEEVQVHAVETQWHTRGNHCQIQLAWDSNRGRIYLLRNSKRNVWLTSSGNNHTRSPPSTPSQSGVSSKQNYTWPVDTQNKEDMLHVSPQQLCNQIYKHGGCTTPNWHTQTRLHHYNRLGCNKIHQTHSWMGLQEPKVYAHMPGYIQKGLLQFTHQTPKAKQNRPHPHVKPQCGTKAQYTSNKDTSPPPQRWGGKICARSSRHITLLCQSSGQHNPPSTKCNHHQARISNGESNWSNNKTTVRLLCNAGQSGTCMQSKQNDSCSTQWHRILQKKKLRSQVGGHFFLSNDNKLPPNNCTILTITTIIKAVISLAVEAIWELCI